EMAPTAAVLLLGLLSTAVSGGTGCPACSLAALAPGARRDALLALAKRNILSELRLQERPSVSRPPSRGALLAALSRASTRRPLPDTPPALSSRTQRYQVLSFAESGSSSPGRIRLHFRFTQELGRSIEVLQASLYLFWASPSPGTHQVTVKVLQPDLSGPNITMVSKTWLEMQRAGWASLDVGEAVQSLFSNGRQRLTVELETAEDLGSPLLAGQSDSHWPFVAAQARDRAPHRVQRRGIDCTGDSRMCCRKEFFVDFKEIGWEDWIIQPEGYHMNYCAGLCPLHMAGIPGLAASFHTAVLNLIKASNADAAVDSCCVPTQRRPLSLLYYDRDSNIVKTDIPDMIVDACGCT
ncbi:INHBC protein, partial [Nothocercus nigrocapillus]|nr:INHBC protein [Nothocercus nigrocapillus]